MNLRTWGGAMLVGALVYACSSDDDAPNDGAGTKVKGVVLMSGGAGVPACGSRLSIIGTVGETDSVPGQPAQAPIAEGHGCDAQAESTVGNNKVSAWPNCDAGWVHRNYFMNGKGHGYSPVDWPEQAMTDDIADAIKSTRQ